MEKQELRNRKRAARRNLTEDERHRKSEEICRRIAALPAFQNARVVMLYAAVPGEVCLEALEKLAPDKRYVYPVISGASEMLAVEPDAEKEETGSGDAGEAKHERGKQPGWRIGAYGISEPDPAMGRIIDPSEIDLVICPCTAFDAKGHRLGMGGGYYDAFLPKCGHAAILAAAFEVQRTERVPVEAHDLRMETVVTESGVHISEAHTF